MPRSVLAEPPRKQAHASIGEEPRPVATVANATLQVSRDILAWRKTPGH
jgi:hypothetical protein